MNASPTLRRPPIASVQRGLELLSHGLYRDIIKELVEQGALTRAALTARLHTSSTKLYECLKTLRAAEVVAVSRRGKALEYEVTESGRELHAVTAIVTGWFHAHPGRPLDPSVGWRAFADLGRSWRMVLVEWIVRRAPSGEDVAEGFDGFNEQQLAETLEAMGHADMVEMRKGRDGLPRYRLTPWAARAIGILAFLARWEDRFRPGGLRGDRGRRRGGGDSGDLAVGPPIGGRERESAPSPLKSRRAGRPTPASAWSGRGYGVAG